MRIIALLVIIASLCASPCFAQDWNTLVPKEIVILASVKDYNAALKIARKAAAQLKQPLDLENYQRHKTNGLSMTPADCDGSGFEFPCYVARGDGDAGNSEFISIEYSNAYEGFRKGYYIVVLAVGDPGSDLISNSLSAAKKYYPTAYAKRTKVWHGCLH